MVYKTIISESIMVSRMVALNQYPCDSSLETIRGICSILPTDIALLAITRDCPYKPGSPKCTMPEINELRKLRDESGLEPVLKRIREMSPETRARLAEEHCVCSYVSQFA